LWPDKFKRLFNPDDLNSLSAAIKLISSVHYSPMSLRNDYERLFMGHGISRQEVCSMTDVEFQKTLDYFLNDEQPADNNPHAGVTSQYRYISPKMAQFYSANAACDDDEALQQAIRDSLNEHYAARAQHEFDDNCIREEQDREYRTACDDADQQTFDTRNQELFHANEAVIAEELQQERDGEVIGRYYSLPPEPMTGSTIGVMVNGERCVRKFDPQCLAADVYSWVAGQTIHCDEGKLYFDEFELAMVGKGVVDPNQTLAEQGMSGRIMLQVVPL
jgi:hypothetical protein